MINTHQSFNKKTSNYLAIVLHNRRVVSPVMMLIQTCTRGVRGKNDKNGAIWCIVSVPKYVIINLLKLHSL